ncbi:MAG: gamma-glutamyl-phosphate reductase, partial [Planctomycetaceae bacterium]
MDTTAYITNIAVAARAAAGLLAGTNGEKRNAALRACAVALRAGKATLQAANAKDLARKDEFGLSDAMIDRLTLTDARIDAMAAGL